MQVMASPDKCAVLIAGPTASGKSALALALAEKIGGAIVNADSMQVYRHLRIITARPTPQDEARVPHLLYGHVDESENYSVGLYCRDAAAALADVLGTGRIPVFVGGTGLYFKSLLTGLAAIPPTPAEIRDRFRGRLEAEGIEGLYRELQARDPATAGRLMPRDRSRILRALEVVEATGRTISDWHRDGMPPAIDPQRAIKVFLDVGREQLARNIEMRFAAMLTAGALDEVRVLDARHLPETLPAMKAHGVPWLRRHLHGEISIEAAAAGAIRDTRRYTKRQVTWFRNQMKGWDWVRPDAAADFVLRSLSRPPG
jgi:tRNA dimethylallyltransferase